VRFASTLGENVMPLRHEDSQVHSVQLMGLFLLPAVGSNSLFH